MNPYPYVETSCPQCRHKLRVRDEYRGRRVRCKYCGGTWKVLAEGEIPAPLEPRGNEQASASASAIVGWSWPESPERSATARGGLTCLGDYELLDEVSRRGMTTIQRARHVGDGRLVNLQVDGRVLPEPNAAAGEIVVSGYEVLETLREGAMGRVLKARQLSLDRLVAIKVLRRGLTRNPEYRERFLREAKIAAKLSHHHFIQVFEAGEIEGRPFYVMEFVSGESLESYLARHPIMEERSALTIALGLAEAIRHAHGLGFVHRDIKPANVLLTADGGLKLADLGLARSVDDDEWAAAEAGMAVGTPEYISPEQIRGQVDVDVRSDIYSLGATLYRMVTGRVPFSAGTTREVMRMHLTMDVPLMSPEAVNPALSAGFRAVIRKMMSRNREERQRTPAELIADLCGLLAVRPSAPFVPAQRDGHPHLPA